MSAFLIRDAREAALAVLRNNLRSGPFGGLPRTAAWGYPEPYTRDLMISSLGVLVSGDMEMIAALRGVLLALAGGQSPLGHISSLAHDPTDRGASDSTPLFLLGLAVYRRAAGEPEFLQPAADRALTWLAYQSPDDTGLIAQQPTSDWRDEQWVLGFGLYVNALVYSCLRAYGLSEPADRVRTLINSVDVRGEGPNRRHEGLLVPGRPHYALWAYKVLNNERFDLLGNSLAILSGLADRTRAETMLHWVEEQCAALRAGGDLAVDLPPNLFPYIRRGDLDWQPRIDIFNRPGEYHNGGIWPFICGFYVAALVAAGRRELAEQKLAALAELVRPARKHEVAFGFNEWLAAYDGAPRGEDWQTWSAAMYLYAAACVEQGRTPFFDELRGA